MNERAEGEWPESPAGPGRHQASGPPAAAPEDIHDGLRRTAPSGAEELDRRPREPGSTDRLATSRDVHIERLDRERQRLIDRLEQRQAVIDWLGRENARLEEALGNAVAHSVLATVYVTIGGGAVCLATFVAAVPSAVAYVGTALLVSGVSVLLIGAFRGRRSQETRPR